MIIMLLYYDRACANKTPSPGPRQEMFLLCNATLSICTVMGSHKHTEWSQCCVTIVYSFHCTIWRLALLYPFIHYLLTPPPCLYFSNERRIEKGAGDSADVRMTRMFQRQGLKLFCFSHTEGIVSSKQWKKKQVLFVSHISSTMTTNNVKI